MENQDARQWQSLPELILNTIFLCLLPSMPDLFSFSFVCRSWRSAAHSLPSGSPPLLFTTLKHQRQPSVQPLIPMVPHSRTLVSPLRSQISLTHTFIAHSQGQLILKTSRYAILADIFSGERRRSPWIGTEYSKFDIGILTSKPSSPSSTLILVGRYNGRTEILSWKLDTEVWLTLRPSLNPPAEIHSLTLFQDTVYGLLSNGGVCTLQFEDLLESEDVGPRSLTFEQIRVQLPEGTPALAFPGLGESLVDCNDNLILVRFVSVEDEDLHHHPPFPPTRIDLYMLNFVTRRWDPFHDLGDFCLFIDGRGCCISSMATDHSCSWLKRNTAYVAWPAHLDANEGYEAIPLNWPILNFSGFLSHWPFPLWALPTLS